MATDTLVMFTEVGDALCVDIVEPVGHWRVFFRGADELCTLLEGACIYKGLPVESATAVLADADGPLMVYEAKRLAIKKRMPCEDCAPSMEPPAAAKDAARCRPAGFSDWVYLWASCAVGAWIAWRTWG